MAIFELVLSKIMLAILFSTAPLFISFTLFKTTHGFFDRWLGACVGFALVMIFVSSMMALALSISQWAIADLYLSHAINISLVGFVPVMIVGFMGVGILLKASHLAQSIGGSVSTTSGSALLAGTVGGVVGSALTSLKMPVPALRATKNFMNAIRSTLNRGADGILEKACSAEDVENAIENCFLISAYERKFNQLNILRREYRTLDQKKYELAVVEYVEKIRIVLREALKIIEAHQVWSAYEVKQEKGVEL